MIQTSPSNNSRRRQRLYALGLITLLMMLLIREHNVYSQPVLGARPTSMGQTSAALATDTWQSWNNPALLDYSTGSVAFFGMRSFGLYELTDMAASVQYPLQLLKRTLGLGGGLHRFGYEMYNETKIRLSVSYPVNKLHIGLGATYNHVNIQDYGSAGTISLRPGLALRPIDPLWIGAYVENPTRAKIGNGTASLPRRLHLGFSWRLIDNLLLTAEAVREDGYHTELRTGLEVSPLQKLFLRTGFQSAMQSLSFGMGYRAGFGSLNLAAERHPTLGWSPALDMRFRW